MTIRPAAAGDAAAIAAIYNEGIEDRVATFETRPREEGEIAGWIAGGLPFVVAETAGSIGFARVSPYSDRCVYDGVGRARRLRRARRARPAARAWRCSMRWPRRARRAGYYKLTSRVFADNGASRAVHRAAGFDEVGVQRRHGRLDGEWKDCVLVERLLGEAAA